MSTIFIVALTALEVGAAVVYFVEGQWWKALYWFSAAVITVAAWRM